jgi:CHAT domain-containing protein
MSLWKVPDFQTQELMTAFYNHWLLEKQALPDAFRAAQLEMRERYENPHFWAGFVLME